MATLIGRTVYQVSLGQARAITVTKHEIREGFGTSIIEGVDRCGLTARLPVELITLDRREAIRKAYDYADGFRFMAEEWEREENEEI